MHIPRLAVVVTGQLCNSCQLRGRLAGILSVSCNHAVDRNLAGRLLRLRRRFTAALATLASIPRRKWTRCVSEREKAICGDLNLGDFCTKFHACIAVIEPSSTIFTCPFCKFDFDATRLY